MVHKDAVAGERLLGILCFAVLGVILSLGLWPFHVPANDVAWLGNRNGLRLGSDSTVISAGAFQAEGRGPGSGSLEIWLQPARVWVSSTFLAFSGTGGGEPFRMRQSLTDLELYVEERRSSMWTRSSGNGDRDSLRSLRVPRARWCTSMALPPSRRDSGSPPRISPAA